MIPAKSAGATLPWSCTPCRALIPCVVDEVLVPLTVVYHGFGLLSARESGWVLRQDLPVLEEIVIKPSPVPSAVSILKKQFHGYCPALYEQHFP